MIPVIRTAISPSFTKLSNPLRPSLLASFRPDQPRIPNPRRTMSATAARADPFKPAKRVAGQRQDVW